MTSLTKIEIPIDYFPRVTVYRRGKKWWWKYSLPNGRSYFCSAGHDERRARQNARLKERDLTHGLFNADEMEKLQLTGGDGPLTIDAAVDRYLSLTSHQKTGDTRNGETATIRDCFQFFRRQLNRIHLQSVTERDVLEFRDHLIQKVAKRDLKSISANNKLKMVKKVFRFYKKRKELLLNPAIDIDPIEVRTSERSRSVVFTQEQVRLLVAAPFKPSSGFDIKAFSMLLYTTGLRPGEARHLEWDDIVYGDGPTPYIHLREKPTCPTYYGLGWKPKWSKDRRVYLNEAAQLLLKRLPRVQSVGFVKNDPTPYSANFVFVTKDRRRGGMANAPWQRVDYLRHSWRELLKAAGLWTPEREGALRDSCPFSRHDLRRSWSAHAKESGLFNVEEASRVLGHDPSVNIQHYAGRGNDAQLGQKMAQHPSNDLKLVQLVQLQ